MNTPLVSIVLPFYNEEKYLARAVASLLKQSYTQLEIILIDDGSTDDSARIARELALQNEQLVLIQTPHHSIGRSRNLGVERSTGKYIAYLDSDDELQADAIEKMVSVMESGNADAVIGAFGMCTTDGEIFKTNNTNGLPINPKEGVLALCGEKIANVVWAKLFKAALCKQISFTEGIWFEDGPYLMAYFYQCTNPIATINELTVKHYCRQDSVTRQILSAQRIRDTYSAFGIALNLTKNRPYSKEVEKHLFAYYQRALLNNLMILTMDHNQLGDSKEIELVFEEVFSRFKTIKRAAGIHFGPRTMMNSWLMGLPKWIGWNLFYALFPILKRKLFSKIAAIRALA